MQHTTSAGLKCGSVSRNLLTTIAYCLRTSSRSPSLLSHAYRRGISQPAPRLGRKVFAWDEIPTKAHAREDNGVGRIFTKKSKAARRLKTTAGP